MRIFPTRQHILKTTRLGIKYEALIVTDGNRKEIEITSSSPTRFGEMWSFASSLLRFENLFDGCFFAPVSCEIDGQEYISDIKSCLLPYIFSESQYTVLPLNVSNGQYRRYYFRWVKYEHTFLIPHSIFLYSTYRTGLSVDASLALLLQVFEPLSEHLKKLGRISCERREREHRCKRCGYIIHTKEDPTFTDRLTAIVNGFGLKIFAGDSKRKLVQKATKTRNLLSHAKIKPKGTLSGKQCGFYLYKFSMLYRYVVLYLLDAINESVDFALENYMEQLNQRFSFCRVI